MVEFDEIETDRRHLRLTELLGGRLAGVVWQKTLEGSYRFGSLRIADNGGPDPDVKAMEEIVGTTLIRQTDTGHIVYTSVEDFGRQRMAEQYEEQMRARSVKV